MFEGPTAGMLISMQVSSVSGVREPESELLGPYWSKTNLTILLPQSFKYKDDKHVPHFHKYEVCTAI